MDVCLIATWGIMSQCLGTVLIKCFLCFKYYVWVFVCKQYVMQYVNKCNFMVIFTLSQDKCFVIKTWVKEIQRKHHYIRIRVFTTIYVSILFTHLKFKRNIVNMFIYNRIPDGSLSVFFFSVTIFAISSTDASSICNTHSFCFDKFNFTVQFVIVFSNIKVFIRKRFFKISKSTFACQIKCCFIFWSDSEWKITLVRKVFLWSD